MKQLLSFLNQKLTTSQTIIPLFTFILIVSSIVNEGFLNFNESNRRAIEEVALSTKTIVTGVPIAVSISPTVDVVPEVIEVEESSELSAVSNVTIVPIVVATEPTRVISTVQELDSVIAGTVFFTPENQSDFYTVSKSLIEKGQVLHLNFDLIKGAESIGSFGLYYLASVLIAKDEECSQIIPTTTFQDKEAPPTPLLDSMKGICAVLSIAHSLNYTLGVPVPEDYPSPTYSYEGSTAEYWDTSYLESMIKHSGITDIEEGLSIDQEYIFYKNYIKSAKKVVEKVWGERYEYTKKEWKKIVTQYEGGGTDCILDTGSHASHISNIYTENNKKYIQITDTLNQGNEQHLDTPINPGLTTFLVKKNGILKAVSHTGVSEWAKSYWEKEEHTSFFQIICYTPIY